MAAQIMIMIVMMVVMLIVMVIMMLIILSSIVISCGRLSLIVMIMGLMITFHQVNVGLGLPPCASQTNSLDLKV